jgi:hypothetical protein
VGNDLMSSDDSDKNDDQRRIIKSKGQRDRVWSDQSLWLKLNYLFFPRIRIPAQPTAR